MSTTVYKYSKEILALRESITKRFGLCPSFFMLAKDTPELAWQLWNMAQFAYLDNPLPSLFKEKLFTYLSRFCYSVPYCVARHLAFLVGVGRPSGDPAARIMKIEEVLDLLKRPITVFPEAKVMLDEIALIEPLVQWPESGSELEWKVIIMAACVFTRKAEVSRSQAELRRLLGSTQYDWLMLLLAFVRMAHFWTETHPELVLEEDVEELLRSHEPFANWLYRYRGDILKELAV